MSALNVCFNTEEDQVNLPCNSSIGIIIHVAGLGHGVVGYNSKFTFLWAWLLSNVNCYSTYFWQGLNLRESWSMSAGTFSLK